MKLVDASTEKGELPFSKIAKVRDKPGIFSSSYDFCPASSALDHLGTAPGFGVISLPPRNRANDYRSPWPKINFFQDCLEKISSVCFIEIILHWRLFAFRQKYQNTHLPKKKVSVSFLVKKFNGLSSKFLTFYQFLRFSIN